MMRNINIEILIEGVRRGMLVILLFGVVAIVAVDVEAQAKVRCPGNTRGAKCGQNNQSTADARWAAYWRRFSSAIANKNKRQFLSLTSKNFKSAGGETAEEWLDGVGWAEVRKSIRRGTKPDLNDRSKPWRITRNQNSEEISDLLFVYENGRWGFYAQKTM